MARAVVDHRRASNTRERDRDPAPARVNPHSRHSFSAPFYDCIIVGGGIAGMATALRLAAAGEQTCVLESHATVGGCAGSFRRRGFSFDVGATTLVDFEPGGVGGEFLETVGIDFDLGERLPGYVAWMPDRTVTLARDAEAWHAERLRAFGDTPRHRALWAKLDTIAHAFWRASRRGVRLPIRTLPDARQALCCLGPRHLPLLRYLPRTLGQVLEEHGLRDDVPLVSLLSMLVEDTVHSTIDEAPAINAALGITIRGAGLTRATGGMEGFWDRLVARYRELGGDLRLRTRALAITGEQGDFHVETTKGCFRGARVVSALPVELAAPMGPTPVAGALQGFIDRDAKALGGAIIVFLGVPESEVAAQEWTHHQLLESYDAPLGSGNNMFISVSAPGDRSSAPKGHRAVMISTHCELEPWENLSRQEYRARRSEIGERLITLARRVYPELGTEPTVLEVGTPRSYERFTRRPHGAVGGARQTLLNSNQKAIPHDIGVPGFRLVGDRTWPGLGTVACVLGSRIVAEDILLESRRRGRRARGARG